MHGSLPKTHFLASRYLGPRALRPRHNDSYSLYSTFAPAYSLPRCKCSRAQCSTLGLHCSGSSVVHWPYTVLGPVQSQCRFTLSQQCNYTALSVLASLTRNQCTTLADQCIVPVYYSACTSTNQSTLQYKPVYTLTTLLLGLGGYSTCHYSLCQNLLKDQGRFSDIKNSLFLFTIDFCQ